MVSAVGLKVLLQEPIVRCGVSSIHTLSPDRATSPFSTTVSPRRRHRSTSASTSPSASSPSIQRSTHQPHRRPSILLSHIPVEILLTILEHVATFAPLERQLTRKRLAATCHFLHTVITPDLFRAPLLQKDSQWRSFLAAMRHDPTLGAAVRDLDLSQIASRWFTVAQTPLLHLLPSLPRLTHLNVSLCGSLNEELLPALAQHCPQLAHLNIAYIDLMGPAAVDAFVQAMAPTFHFLDVSYNEQILEDPQARHHAWRKRQPAMTVRCLPPDHESDIAFASIFLMGYQGLSTSRDVSTSFGWAVDASWGRSRRASSSSSPATIPATVETIHQSTPSSPVRLVDVCRADHHPIRVV